MCSSLKLLLAIISLAPAGAHADELIRDALFHIERSKNANIVQYDAQLGTDGNLHTKTPVVGYWIRLAHDGEIKELSWAQKKFAYGFKIKHNKKDNTASMDMAADLGRSITIMKEGEDYRAVANIDGVNSFIDKIFIHSSGSGLSTKVEYVDLFGKSVTDQAELYERFNP
jgi:hypothetical protein